MSAFESLPKYLQRSLEGRKFPCLLVTKDKYESAYYLLGSREDLWKASLKILKDRVAIRYIQAPAAPYGLHKDVLTADQAAALPFVYRQQEEARIKGNARILADHTRDEEQWTAVQKILEDSDGVGAFQVLHDRRDHEYEGFEFETMEKF